MNNTKLSIKAIICGFIKYTTRLEIRMRVVNKSSSKIVYMSVTKLFGYYVPEVVILYSLKMLNEKSTFPFRVFISQINYGPNMDILCP